MTLEDFQRFIDEQDALFRHAGASQTERERIFARTVKMAEEFGELCGEVLASAGDQRKEKLTEHTPETFKDELADVLITTFLLAKSMNIDLMSALDSKVQKIKERRG